MTSISECEKKIEQANEKEWNASQIILSFLINRWIDDFDSVKNCI